MTKLTQKDFSKILTFISTHNFRAAFEFTENLLLKKVEDKKLNQIYLFLLTELDKFDVANKQIDILKDEENNFFVRSTFKNLNMMEEYKNLCFDDLYSFEASILSYDFRKAKERGLFLTKESCKYFLFSMICLIIFEERKIDKVTEKLVRSTILKIFEKEKMKIPADVFLLLVKNKIIDNDWIEYLKITENGGSITLFSLKHLLINNMITESNYLSLNEYLNENKIIISIDNFDCFIINLINFLIKNIDDGDLYEYAIKYKIRIDTFDTPNYLHYKLKKDLNIENFMRVYKITNSFRELENLFEKCNLLDFSKKKECFLFYAFLKYEFINNINFVCDNLLNELLINEIKFAFDNYKKEKSLTNTKLILAFLISTKQENNLLLALKIANDCKDLFKNTYEIKLIFLFICRFFCWYDKVIEIYEELEIKTVIQEKLAYLWSDLNIILNLNDNSRKEKYLNYRSHLIKHINCSLLVFIQNYSFYHGIELIKTKKMLENSNLYKEINQNKIISNDPETHFSFLLGSKCRFLFDKICINSENNYFKDLKLATIYNLRKETIKIENLLINYFENIDDEVTIDLIKNLISYQDKKIK
ncbi:hypothetical protein GVAV_002463 [Gurleya vavrai]